MNIQHIRTAGEFNISLMDGAIYGTEENIKAYAARFEPVNGKCPEGHTCSSCLYHAANYAYGVSVCLIRRKAEQGGRSEGK